MIRCDVRPAIWVDWIHHIEVLDNAIGGEFESKRKENDGEVPLMVVMWVID